MIEVTTKGDSIESIIKEMMALPRHVEAARPRALRAARKTLRTRIKRQLASRLRIPQKSFADRFYLPIVPKGAEEAKLWVGGWAISPFSVGKPKQIGTRVYRGKKARSMLGGVSVGNYSFYRGAFLGSVYSAKEQIWIRLRSKWYNRDLYPTMYRAGDRFSDPNLKHRFPVVRASIPIEKHLKDIWKMNGDEAGAELLKKFRQELNYEVNVKGLR